MTIRVHFTTLLNPASEVLQMARALAACSPELVLTETAASAEVIFYIDNGYYGLHQLRDLTSILKQHAGQEVYVYSESDWPFFWAPGAYPSLSRRVHDSDPFFSWCYLQAAFGSIATADLPQETPRFLFSFLGRQSTHPVRTRIAALHSNSSPCLDIKTAGNFFTDYSYTKTYHQLIMQSSFVLCPRGYGRGNIRMFEAMSHGRAPVIISDDWKATCDPDIAACALFIAEKDIARIPALLAGHESEAAELGRKAKSLFDQFYAPAVFFPQLIKQCRQRNADGDSGRLLRRSLLRYGLAPWHLKTFFLNLLRPPHTG